MDWGRAKNIILIVLLAVNVMLMTVYGIQYVRTQKNDSEIHDYTMQKMEEVGITISCDMPDSGARMSSISVKYQTISSEKKKTLLKEASNKTALSDKDNISEYVLRAEKFARNCGFSLSNCQRDADINKKGSGRITFQGCYNDIELKECYIKVIFERGIITDIDYKWYIPVNERSTKQRLTDPAAAILSLISDNMENTLDDSEEIVDENDLDNDAGSDYSNDEIGSGGEDSNNEVVSGGEDSNNEVDSGGEDSDDEAGSGDDLKDESGSGDDAEAAQKRISLKGREIVGIKLVYYVDDSDMADEILYDTAFPAWEIILDNGSINYFFAFQQ